MPYRKICLGDPNGRIWCYYATLCVHTVYICVVVDFFFNIMFFFCSVHFWCFMFLSDIRINVHMMAVNVK